MSPSASIVDPEITPVASTVVNKAVEAELAPIAVPSILPALMSTAGIVAVPVKVGEAVLALEFTAVSMLENSVLSSVPLTTLEAFPDGRESLAAKSTVLEYEDILHLKRGKGFLLIPTLNKHE